MIHSIKIKNFFSIKDEKTINFTTNENQGDNDSYIKILDQKVSKLNLFVGGNGSGKTNVFRAFAFLQWFITAGQRQIVNNQVILPFSPYFDNSKDWTELEITFSINNIIYDYKIHFLQSQLMREELSKRELVEKNITKKYLFIKTLAKVEELAVNDKVEKKYKIEGDIIKEYNLEKVADGGVLQSVHLSMISQLGDSFGITEFKNILNYFRNIITDVPLYSNGQINNMPFLNLMQLKNNDKLKKKIENLLSDMDLGFKSFEADIMDRGNGNVDFNNAFEYHNNGAKNNILYSSNGTRKLFIMIHQLFHAIENKTPFIVDEFDLFLHNNILEKLIDFILLEEDLQIIISSHQHLIMNRFDKYQIHLVEKANLSTDIYRLDNVQDENGKGLRNTENFFLNYTSGKYGGINNI